MSKPQRKQSRLHINNAQTATIRLFANVGGTQIEDKDDHFLIRGIPITMDGAVMNGIRYPAEENEKGMQTLVNKNITLSHPSIDGENVSSYEGEALIKHYAGGYVSNTYRSNGIWYADAKINKKRLKSAEDGEQYYNRLESKEPIGVSTGLYGLLGGDGGVENGEEYRGDMTEQNYDHLAMLSADERPAGGDVTVMRFNGKDEETVTVNIDDIIGNHQQENSSGLDFTGGHRAMMQAFTERAEEALKERIDLDDDEYLFIEDWNDDTMLFYRKGDTFTIGYDDSGDQIQFSGEPVQVSLSPSYTPVQQPKDRERELTEDEQADSPESLLGKLLTKIGFTNDKQSGDNVKCKPKFTTQTRGTSAQNKHEGMSMSHYDALAKRLNMNSDEVKALSDDELEAKLNSLGGGESQTQAGTNSQDITQVVSEAVTAALNAQKQQEQEGQKKDLVAKLSANKAVALSEAQLNKLDVEDLQELQDKHGVTNGLNAGYNGNAGEQLPEMPE